jgi:hypothetical protein
MGWSQWTQWTICVSGKQSRSRECDGSVRCYGHYREMRYCSPTDQSLTSDESDPSINSVEDKTAYKSSASSKNSDPTNHVNSYSLQKLLIYCFVSFICGALVSGLFIYIYMTKNDRIRHMRHQRLSLKLFSSLKPSSNAYESPQDYKSNESTLSPLNSISPVREATIKVNKQINC